MRWVYNGSKWRGEGERADFREETGGISEVVFFNGYFFIKLGILRITSFIKDDMCENLMPEEIFFM